MIDEMQWSVQMLWRLLSRVSFLSRPDARQHYFWVVRCILVCHPHLTIILCCTAVWAQACGLDHKTSFIIIVHLWFFRHPKLFSLVVGVVVYYSDLRNCDNSCSVCVFVNTLQSHDTVDLVQDSETEDPQHSIEAANSRTVWKTRTSPRGGCEVGHLGSNSTTSVRQL